MRLSYYFNTWKHANKKREEPLTKQHFHIHYIWKYRYLVPVLKIGELVMSKHLEKKVPPGREYDYLRSFYQSVEESIPLWAEWIKDDYNERRKKASHFRRFMTKDKDDQWVERFLKGSGPRWIRLMRDLLITICIHDTAYKPLFEIITREYKARLDHKEEQTWEY